MITSASTQYRIRTFSLIDTQRHLWLQLPVSCPLALLRSVINAYHNRIGNLEAEKYDLEYEVARKNLEVRACKALSPQHVHRDQGDSNTIFVGGHIWFAAVWLENGR